MKIANAAMTKPTSVSKGRGSPFVEREARIVGVLDVAAGVLPGRAAVRREGPALRAEVNQVSSSSAKAVPSAGRSPGSCARTRLVR